MIPYAKLRARARASAARPPRMPARVVIARTPARARRVRDGRGRCVNTSHRAASSASSAASPPRAKSPTARPIRPPIRSCSTRPPASRLRARVRLVAEQLEELGARAVERGDAEPAAVLERQVDAAELEIARHVLQEVDELQPGADVVARGDELGLVRRAAAGRAPADRRGRPSGGSTPSGRPRSRTRRCADPSGSPRSAAGTARAEARTRGWSARAPASPATTAPPSSRRRAPAPARRARRVGRPRPRRRGCRRAGRSRRRARRCGRRRRGKSTEATGKFSVRARRATTDSFHPTSLTGPAPLVNRPRLPRVG